MFLAALKICLFDLEGGRVSTAQSPNYHLSRMKAVCIELYLSASYVLTAPAGQ